MPIHSINCGKYHVQTKEQDKKSLKIMNFAIDNMYPYVYN